MRKLLAFIPLISLLIPSLASAHEVYVLDQATIARDLAMHSPNPFEAYLGNEITFFFWGTVSVVTVLAVFFSSIFRRVENAFIPIFGYLKKLAHPMVRITCGVCLIASGYYAALFGPELPFSLLFGNFTEVVQIICIAAGVMILAGLYTRYVALVMLAMYFLAAIEDGYYILTYANYFGEFFLLVVLGSGVWSVDKSMGLGRMRGALASLAHRFEHAAFPIMRITFGFGIIFASVYAKFLHSQLALDVVTQYNLTNFFPFDPLFVVLGAMIIEFIAGLFLVIGFEIRWTCLFLLFWLTLSLLYFGESVWPHLVLFGLGLAIFFHGYDRYSLEGYFMKKRKIEPVF